MRTVTPISEVPKRIYKFKKTFTGTQVSDDAVPVIQKPQTIEYQIYSKNGDMHKNKSGSVVDIFV